MKYPNVQPFGTLVVSAPGTTILLSANCGPLQGGATGTRSNPPLPGSALRGIVLQAASPGNVGNVYLLPRGNTALGNPDQIIAVIPPNSIVPVPYGVLLDDGILPENFCLDADTGGNVVFGYGIF